MEVRDQLKSVWLDLSSRSEIKKKWKKMQSPISREALGRLSSLQAPLVPVRVPPSAPPHVHLPMGELRVTEGRERDVRR